MATWTKLFSNFVWRNRPDTSTPLGQTLLNRLNNAINGIDDRVVALNAQKASTDDLNGAIINVSLNEKTGIFTFTRFNGTTFTINTALEEVVTNFKYDNATQQLVLTLADGTTQNVDLSALITQYEFTSSATILFTTTEEGKVVANIKPNSITDQMLQTNYLANITTQANTAVSASQSALESQSLAEQFAEDAEASANRAEAAADRAESVSAVEIATTTKAGIVKPDGTTITVDADGTIHGNASVTVDTTLDANSTNPIANKAVAEAFENVDAKTLDGHGAEYFFPKSGGTITGNLLLRKTTAETSAILSGNANGEISLRVEANGTRGLFDNTNSDYLLYNDGTNKVFKGTASENIAKGASGPQTVGAPTTIPIALNNIHASSTATLIKFALRGEQLGRIGFVGVDKPGFVDSNNATMDFLHTGNKPTGSYTGNGIATARTVNVGGVCPYLIISTSDAISFVRGTGALVISPSKTEWHGSSEIKYENGILSIASTSGYFNGSGVAYVYENV